MVEHRDRGHIEPSLCRRQCDDGATYTEQPLVLVLAPLPGLLYDVVHVRLIWPEIALYDDGHWHRR